MQVRECEGSGGHGATIGIDSKELYEYSIRVRKEDLENAKWLIR